MAGRGSLRTLPAWMTRQDSFGHQSEEKRDESLSSGKLNLSQSARIEMRSDVDVAVKKRKIDSIVRSFCFWLFFPLLI